MRRQLTDTKPNYWCFGNKTVALATLLCRGKHDVGTKQNITPLKVVGCAKLINFATKPNHLIYS